MIRAATHADIPALVTLGEAFFAMSPYASYCSYDPTSLEVTLLQIIDNGFLHVSTDGEGQIVAALAGVIHPLFFNHTVIVGSEVAWFVREDARGGGAAIRLQKLFELWAKERGATLCAMSSLETNRKMERLYERTGYKPCEHTHVKEL